MKRTWIAGTLMLLIALVLAGCEGQTAAPTTSQPPKPTAAPTPTEQMAQPTVKAEPTAGPAPTAAPEPTAVGGDLTLDSRDAGLDQLKSYRVVWKADWETTKDGKTEQANWDWLLESTADPVGSLTVWKGADASGSAPGSWEHWEDGSNAGYVSIDADGKKTCASLWNARYFSPAKRNVSSIPGLFFLPRMLGSLSGAKYAGTETVNGIRSNRYTYDEKAANRADLGKVAGEIWVAADGGYVVRDTVSWEGGAIPFGAETPTGESGHGSWTWELTDLNGAITIPPLAGCDSATDGLPIISGAYQKTVTGDVMVYQAFHGEKVVPFYQKEMVAGGWKQSGEPTSKEAVSTAAFTRDGQKASVTVTSKGQISDVKIEVTKEQ
jgi:hypothetical protein